MRHKSIRKKLLRYLDNDLSDGEMQHVQRHLESCQSCQDDLKTIESLWRIDRPIERMTAPPFLWTRISTRLEEEERQSFVSIIKDALLPALRPAIIIAGLLLVLVGGMELGNMITLSADDRAEILIDNTMENFGLSYFEVLPPGSIDARVLALTESELQK